MTCNDRQDLIIAHLLGTLDAAEERALRDHLGHGCPTCAGFLAEMTEVLGHLPLAQAHLATPPAGLRQQLMGMVAPTTPPPPPPPPEAPPSAAPSGTGSALESGVALMNRPLTFGQAAAAVAALLIIAALSVSVAVVYQRGKRAVSEVEATCAFYVAHLTELEDRVDALTVRLLATPELSCGPVDNRDALIEELEAELLPAAATLAELAPPADLSRRLAATLRASGLRFSPLAPAAGVPGSTDSTHWSVQEARILLDPDRDTWYLFADGLPEVEADRIYQLWFLKGDGTRTSAGSFRVGPQGRGFLTGRVPPDVGELEIAVITEEPAAGTAGLTGPVHLAGEL